MHSDGKTRRVAPGRTRYIKLGEGGAWEKQCLRENVIRFSFGTGRPELFPLCVGGDWERAREILSGSVNKLSAYRGTSCSIDVEDYLVRRINGEKTPQVERAIGRVKAMRDSALELMRLLGPHDFETLVDLVFSTSGWRRQGIVGKTQKTLDLDLMLPSTGERAFVQVKARTDAAEFESYLAQLDSLGPYDRMFYVFHTGSVATDDKRVTIVGPERLAELVVDAGLVDWLLRKVS
jgi:hypothetical protein